MTGLEAAWATLRESGEVGTGRKLSADPTSMIFAYLDTDLRAGLYFAVANEPPNVPIYKAIAIRKAPRLDGKWALTIVLIDRDLDALFRMLCDDLISAVAQSKPEDTGSFVVGRLHRWKRLLDGDRGTSLTLPQTRGLFAELLILRNCFRFRAPDEVVHAWVGPLDAPQDFAFSGRVVEVKAVVPDAFDTMISSVPQLDIADSVRGALAIVAIKSLPAAMGSGTTISDLTTDITATLGAESALAQEFAERLRAAGCQEPETYDALRFEVTYINWCSIEGAFPRIRADALSEGIGEVSYSISLAVARRSAVKEEDWWR